ncbi:hypothetical protein PVAND_015061 [Polypedilum vanderplanki]|uniref:Fatty acid desaturase domain-containing protein n=1 Tax=Polypedilum vanderplanki TaxID=319348 RepID=A0A9J6BBI2_POLVA|nr:hypothetical protein PVAND_015061 [Polypedilum vanderplanki]
MILGKSEIEKSEKPFKKEIVWRNVFLFSLIHLMALNVYFHWNWNGFLFHFFYGLFSAFGISAGAHRLWSHRSYKANFKLQVLLMIMQTICIENDVIEWVRDHRVHHKFSDTDADPHNSQRGLFFSHMGWLLCKKHPDVRKYGSKVDMSDIESEPVLKFQRKFYIPLVLIFSFIIPIKISMYLVGHDLMVGICAIFCRYVISLHLVWFTNSFAHVGSWKPYDKNIAPSDSKFFGIICFGEGWHNFHHVFPWDYKVSELPLYRYNFTIAFIDFFSWLGWATDLKIASDDMIKARVLRTGDGSHPYSMKSTRKVKKLDENCNIVEFMKSDESYWGLGMK